MNNTKVATFWLENYKIKKFTFNEPKNPESVDVGMDFQISGVFFKKELKYEMTLKFSAFDENSSKKSNFITTEIIADYVFYSEDNFEEIPGYFFQNSIAILFPYLRSFISTLTLQAGLRILILPIMNLSGLRDSLEENTTYK